MNGQAFFDTNVLLYIVGQMELRPTAPLGFSNVASRAGFPLAVQSSRARPAARKRKRLDLNGVYWRYNSVPAFLSSSAAA